MSDKKISQLALANTPLTGAEILPIVQNGNTVKISANDFTSNRSVPANNIALNGASIYSDAKVNVLGDGISSPVFINTNGGINNVKYDAISISTDNSNYSVKLQVSRGAGSYDLGASLRLVNSSGTEFESVDFKSSGNVIVNTGNLVISTSGKGIVLKSPNGLITKTLTIDNAGLIALI